eukprot:Gb_30542 [translate_table: standard]
MEKQTGRKIRVLRSDNGGEYTSNDFKDFCVQEGIKRELIVPYNQQQHGVAERKNRAIVGAARAMLHNQGLPFFLWAEACNTIVYIQNRSPHMVLGSKTPEEAFTGKKLEVGHFQIFGCLTYSHVPSEKRTKLEPTAEKGIFVGYDKTSKAYRIYITALRKTIVQRDVRFEEDRAFRKSRESEQGEQQAPRPQMSSPQVRGSQSTGSKVLGVTGSQVTGPQVTGSQTTGAQSSGTRSSDKDEQEESPPQEVTSRKRKPRWFLQTLKEAKEHVESPKRVVRESKAPERFCSYMALVSSISESEPSTFEEAIDQKVWRDAMVEEYNSIMKNDVWEIVPRPEGKSIVTSR